MSGRDDAIRQLFHAACRQAVTTTFGREWLQLQSGLETWASAFSRRGSPLPQMLVLTYRRPQHLVDVIVAAWRRHTDETVHLPRIWWEDRHLHPDEAAYKRVFWTQDVAYGREEGAPVPRQTWSPAFLDSLKTGLQRIHAKALAWWDEMATQG